MRHGYYCPDPVGSPAYYEYWNEQRRRRVEGYSVGGRHITGHHYNYLNFTRIKRQMEREGGVKKMVRKRRRMKDFSFPDFWDGDYEYFHLLDIAFHGIEPEELALLELETTIDPDWLDGGHFLLVAKARRKGFSFKNASVAANAYDTIARSYNLFLAYDSEYLFPKGIMTMAIDNLNFYNEHTAWAKRQLIKKRDHRKAGFIEYDDDGRAIEKGYLSEIQAISLRDDPHGTRGKDGTYVFVEEGGQFPNLKESYWVGRSIVEDGGIVTGCMVIFGTGGDMEKGTIDFHQMYYNPKAYNMLPMSNIWDRAAGDSYSSYFFPAYKNKIGFYDKDGNSDIVKAKAAEEARRETIRDNSDDPTDIARYITENAWCGREAFLRIGDNMLPAELANDWLNELEVSRRHLKIGRSGTMLTDKETSVFRPDERLVPLYDFPIRDRKDKGCVVVYQAPYKDSSGAVPNNLYVVVHDPYDQPQGESLGVAYVLKLPNNESKPDDIIVASYVGRPGSQDEYNATLFALARYYNARIQFESDRGNVIQYAKYTDQLELLVEELEIVDKRNNVHFRKLGRGYGMSIGTTYRKTQGLFYLRDWLKAVRSVKADGTKVLNLHAINDPGLLREIIMFDPERGNYDRIMAMVQYVYYLKDREAKMIHTMTRQRKDTDDSNSFWRRQLFR